MTIALTITTLAVDTTNADGLDVTQPDNELLTHINNILNGLQKAETLRFTGISTPAAPSAGEFKLYFKTDGAVYVQNSSGSEASITGIDVLQYQCFT